MTDMSALRTAMVDCQVRPSDVTRYAIIEAMLWAPRERFVPQALQPVAYAGAEIPLAPGRVMLEPRTLAKMLEAAAIGPQDRVLDLAPGTGYSTAVIARMATRVVAVEPDVGMAAQAAALLAGLGLGNARVQAGEAAAGSAADGPFDVIFVNGAVDHLPPALTAQLVDGGRLVALWRDGRVGQARVTRRAGAGLSSLAVFDAIAPVVPGFAQAPAFVF